MPYRNVYEDKNRRISGQAEREPEKDPKKIAEIYKRQIPTSEDRLDTLDKIAAERTRVDRAKKLDRGIRKSILGKPQNRGR